MKIAIIAAMDKELALLLPLVPDHTTVNVNGFEYYRGHFGAHELVITRCGIGKVNAAISTLTLIDTFHPQLVINTGVAGGARGGAGVLDVVVAALPITTSGAARVRNPVRRPAVPRPSSVCSTTASSRVLTSGVA